MEQLVVTRTFAAPRERVYAAWTEAEQLARWWGPAGFAITVLHLDARPGGEFFYRMEGPGMPPLWGKFVFRQLAPPERIVFVNSICDAEGHIIAHPLAPDWPKEIVNTVTLTEQDGVTTLTIAGGPVNASEQEQTTFQSMRPMVQQGFAATFDQLAAYLAGQR